MVKVEILKNATILAPNRLHQNFTATENYLQKGKELKGEYITINGRRRGSEFDYRLFRTEKGNLIYAKNVKPINTETMTEVNLGVDGRPTPTKIKMPNDKKYDNAHIYAAVLGTLGGFALAKKMKKSKKQLYMYAIGGAIAGYVSGKLLTGKPVIDVSISK